MLPPASTSRQIHPLRTHGPDEAIRATDDDAAASRRSAVGLGYLTDPFVSILSPPPSTISSSSSPYASGSARKPPLINIGTHHRTWAIDTLVDRFFDAAGEKRGQLVGLGAGSDTRFFRLMARSRPPRLKKYIELDFPDVTASKAKRIASNPQLCSILSSPSAQSPNDPSDPDSRPAHPHFHLGQDSIVSSTYALLPVDLRDQPASSLSTTMLPYLDTSIPTLFLAECVFCYMIPEKSKDVIKWFGENFDCCVGVIYEMCGLTDTFGQVMRRNLSARGLSIPGAEPFPTVASEAQRFLDPTLGQGVFAASSAKSLWQIRQNVIDPHEIKRISKLEMLDEIEELKLVLSHYFVAWGAKGEAMAHVGL